MRRLGELLSTVYEGYSIKPWARRSALFIGLALLAYALGSFAAGRPEIGVAFLGGSIIWFFKMLTWSVIKSGSRRPPTV